MQEVQVGGGIATITLANADSGRRGNAAGEVPRTLFDGAAERIAADLVSAPRLAAIAAKAAIQRPSARALGRPIPGIATELSQIQAGSPKSQLPKRLRLATMQPHRTDRRRYLETRQT